MKRSEILFGVLRIPVDFFMAVLGFSTAYLIRSHTDLIPGVSLPTTMPPWNEFMLFLVWSALGLIALCAVNGMYSLRTTSRFRKECLKLWYILVTWVGCIVGYYFLVRSFFPSRLLLIYGWVLCLAFVPLGRWAIRGLQAVALHHGVGRHRVVIIGAGTIGRSVEEMYRASRGYDVVQVLKVSDPELLTKLEVFAEEKQMDIIIQASELTQEARKFVMDICHEHHIRYRFVPDVLQVRWLSLRSFTEGGIPLQEVVPSPLDGWGRVWKRGLDIIGSITGIILLLPFIIATALAVWMQMGRWKHIIFRQKRYGQEGKLFWFYKFQSMYVGAEAEHKKLMEAQQGERKGLLKIDNDPRVTPVGRVIRKTSLDELPQLWNVLKGDMSLVGPRPHMPQEVDLVKKTYSPILHMKPGITGLPQVSGRSMLSFDDEMKLDMYYLEHWSLWMDVSILFRTVWVVVLRRNVS